MSRQKISILLMAFFMIGVATLAQSQEHDMSSMNHTDIPMKEANEMEVAHGKGIYAMSCVYCHGISGKGDGAASMFIGPYSHPRPNDFTARIFKFRSTESGQLPLLTDLMRTIREGIPGIMPSFRNMGESGIRAVAAYLQKEFIQRPLPTKTTIKYVEHVGPYTYSVESVYRGMALYREMGCAGCHGQDGKGTGEHLTDQRELRIHPIDLTRTETFGNGVSHEDIYRTLMTGLDGTPMPSFGDFFIGQEDRAWDLVHYILSLREK
ncbi:MAG: c-type cytochrome [Nitrospirae bacterium]|nr:c-type cytochrome [Candidatus Troglogloeales bacterium]